MSFISAPQPGHAMGAGTGGLWNRVPQMQWMKTFFQVR